MRRPPWALTLRRPPPPDVRARDSISTTRKSATHSTTTCNPTCGRRRTNLNLDNGEPMHAHSLSRRQFLGTSALGAIAGASVLTNPPRRRRGGRVQTADCPISRSGGQGYVLDRKRIPAGRPTGYTQIASIVTNSGLEGNYTLASRYWHPNWSNQGCWSCQKRMRGQSVLDLPALTSQWVPEKRRVGQSSYASAIDNCLWTSWARRWACRLPDSRSLPEPRDGICEFAASRHDRRVCPGGAEIQDGGIQGLQIHPPSPNGGHDYKVDIEVCRAVRKAAGDDFSLMHDPVGVYTRKRPSRSAGRSRNWVSLLRGPAAHEGPRGLVELAAIWTCRSMSASSWSQSTTMRIHPSGRRRRGPFSSSTTSAASPRLEGGAHANVLTWSARRTTGARCSTIGAFPPRAGDANNVWFEMTVPQGTGDRPYMKDTIRIAPDGYVYAPTKPGLGYELDRDALDKMTVRIDR